MIPRLGVNVDHIATIRNARNTPYPDPVVGAEQALQAGAYGITAHLREDRRHIRDVDVQQLRALKCPKFNLEMALTEEMVDIALRVKPDYVCLVPEKRQELTTEGGLPVGEVEEKIELIRDLVGGGIFISLFLTPNPKTVARILSRFVPTAVELYTGHYAHAFERGQYETPLLDLFQSAEVVRKLKVDCHAGHGLHLDNLPPVLKLRVFSEYNIGHAIVARSIFDGLRVTVQAYVHVLQSYPI